MSGDAAEVAKIIIDKTVTVELKAENTVDTSTGQPYVGGAFMGNTVLSTGNVEAIQEINPKVFGNLGDANDKAGEGVLHEASEGYEGALISEASGISSPDASYPTSVYEMAHKSAHPQPGVSSTGVSNINTLYKLSNGLILPRSYLSPETPIISIMYESNNKTILNRRADGTHTP